MWTDAAFKERGYRALRATLKDDGRLQREMIEFLFEEDFWDRESLTWNAAVARFNDCLNPNKSAFWKIGEVWALMARFGRHELFLAMAEDLGYEVRLKPTEERRLELLERIAVATERHNEELSEARAALARLTPEGEPRTSSAIARFPIEDSVGGKGF